MVDKMSDGLLNIIEHKIVSNLSHLKNLSFNGKLEEKIEQFKLNGNDQINSELLNGWRKIEYLENYRI